MRWQRLDIPGTDSCEVVRSPDGWRLAGTAKYGSGGAAARLSYTVEADEHWQTRRGAVSGTSGGDPVRLAIERMVSGEWFINGSPAPHLTGLIDLDLGFTPATNLFPLRRLALQPGDAADAAAAWLNEEDWSVTRLPQRYERRDAEHYWYESPSVGYAGLLVVAADDGFVREYPGLWRAVP